MLEEAFRLNVMIREYTHLTWTITQNSYFILPQDFLVTWIIVGCLLTLESVNPAFVR